MLLERSRAAELATAAHPVLADGPAVLTLLETVTTALIARGLDPESANWDAWRNEDGRWTVQLAWKAGHSDNAAHFRFTPGAHGGTVTAFDDAACELIDPDFARPLRPVAPVAQLASTSPQPPPRPGRGGTRAAEARAAPPRARKGKPPVPAGRTCCWACVRRPALAERNAPAAPASAPGHADAEPQHEPPPAPALRANPTPSAPDRRPRPG